MFKSNKNLILSSAILAIFALGLFLSPNTTNAEGGSNYRFGSDTSAYNDNAYNNYQYQNYQQPTYVQPVYSAPVNTNPIPTNIYSSGVNPDTSLTVDIPDTIKTKTPKPTVAKIQTPTEYALAYVPINKLNSSGAIRANNEVTTNPDGSNLSANALFASNGFMPKGIIGWILFSIFLLIIVILVRKIFGGAETYHTSPMKHD